MHILEIHNLTVKRGEKTVLSNFALTMDPGDAVLLTGPNGVGKSTLAQAVMGFPGTVVTEGRILLNGSDLSRLQTDERARAGIFLAHQELPAIPGVSAVDVLRASAEALHPEAFSLSDFYSRLRENLELLGLTLDFAKKEMNVAFSGGEKKKIELLSLLMTRPKLAILDEIDAGMDAEAQEKLRSVIQVMQQKGTAFLMISHHPGLFTELHPREFALS